MAEPYDEVYLDVAGDSSRTATVRSEFIEYGRFPTDVELDPDERIIGADHNMYHTWVYIAKDPKWES
jgi:hypothetical protein